MKKGLILLACMVWLGSAWSQASRSCGTVEADSLRRDRHPELGSRADFERWLQQQQRREPSGQVRTQLYTIPVIVHIIHDGTSPGVGDNLSQLQVQSQIEVLNEDFRRLPGTPGGNSHPAGADTEIEFCLATIDTAGHPLPEPGIRRIDRNQLGWNPLPYTMSYLDQTIKPATQWDPDRYLNIWVVRLSNGLLGYAQTPDASTLDDLPLIGGGAQADGVVIRPNAFGRLGHVQAPYDRGRTATHELGHWLGLLHTSGDGGCSVDDGCSDTPVSDGPNYGCDVGHQSCGTPDMVENYLDYSDDACMNTFTNCQKDRMQLVLANSPRRGILNQSNACTSEVPPAAAFIATQRVLCAGQTIQFEDRSLNSPDTWQWSFPGGTPSSATTPNPQVQYTAPGSYPVSLTVSNAYGQTQRTDTAYIFVNANGPSGFFVEDFEGGLPDNWTIENADGSFTWNIRQVAGQPQGNQAAWMNCYNYPAVGAVDALMTPAIDLTYYQGVTLTLDHAYRPYLGAGNSADTLRILASVDGGQTWPDKLWEAGGPELATAADAVGLFVPASSSDWCFAGSQGNGCISLDLAAYDGLADLRLRFETVNQYGNNLYLDNIRLTGLCAVTDLETPIRLQREVLPNPAREQVTLRALDWLGSAGTVTLYDLYGRPLLQGEIPVGQANWEQTWDLRQLPPGLYQIRWQQGRLMATDRLLVEGE